MPTTNPVEQDGVVVPREPTEAMIEAACIVGCEGGEQGWRETSSGLKDVLRKLNRDAYAALLAAAPAPEAQAPAAGVSVDALVEALRWYADSDNYYAKPGENTPILSDGGMRAHTAIAAANGRVR